MTLMKIMNRRTFLTTATSTIMVYTSPLAFASSASIWPGDTPPFLHSRLSVSPELSRRQWKAIIATQQHLFPSGLKKQPHSPGANDINAKAYLYAVLSDPNRDDDDRILVKNGVITLQQLSLKQYKKSFDHLNFSQKENILRTLEKQFDGTSWIMTILGYVFEALLVDPVYGGNPNGIGWKWLDHQPGFPRPGIENRYFLYQRYQGYS